MEEYEDEAMLDTTFDIRAQTLINLTKALDESRNPISIKALTKAITITVLTLEPVILDIFPSKEVH